MHSYLKLIGLIEWINRGFSNPIFRLFEPSLGQLSNSSPMTSTNNVS